MNRPWMPLYVADYLADTAHLNAAESGAYLHLIMHYWMNGSLPNDDRLLARIAKMMPAQWKGARVLVAPFFTEGWKHKRVEFELTEAARISAAGKVGGVASGRARRERITNDRSTTDKRSLNDQPNDSATKREALQLQSQRKKDKEEREERSHGSRGSQLPGDWQPSEDDKKYGLSLGRTAEQIATAAEEMRLWAKANSNRSIGRKADWSATFKGWMRRNGAKHGPHGMVVSAKDERRERWQQTYDKLGESIADDDGREEGGQTYPRLLSSR